MKYFSSVLFVISKTNGKRSMGVTFLLSFADKMFFLYLIQKNIIISCVTYFIENSLFGCFDHELYLNNPSDMDRTSVTLID